MEDAIDASPTQSQKKRKIKLKSYSLRKIKKPDEDTSSGIIESDDCKSFQSNSPDGPVGSTLNGVSNCLTRRDILKNVHLLETANKLPVNSQKVRTISRFNNNRRESRFGFLNVTEQATQELSTSAIPSEYPSNSKSDNITETQFDLTETQISRIDVVEKNYYASVTNTNNTNDQLSIVCDVTNSIREDNETPHDSIQLVAAISSNQSTDGDTVDTGQNLLKRCRSIAESILDEWNTSPVKKKACGSPKFLYNRKLKTYQRQRQIETTLPQLKIVSPGAISNSSISHADDEEEMCRREICLEEVDPKIANDDEVDLNESINVIGNIQCLSKYYSQPTATSTEKNVNETVKSLPDLKCHSSIERSRSHSEEKDFHGFDNKYCTLSERFHGFESDSNDSTFANQRECSQTSASSHKEDLLHEKLPQKSVPKRINSCIRGSVANKLPEKDDLFADIETEYKLEVGRPDKSLDNLLVEFDLMQNNSDLTFHGVDGRLYPLYTGFSTALGRSLHASLELIAKKASVLQSLTVSDDDLKYSIVLIGETIQDSYKQVDHFKDVSSAVLKGSTEEIPYPTFTGFSTAREHILPGLSKKTNISQHVTVSDCNLIGTANRIGDTRDCLMEISLNEEALKKQIDLKSHPAGFTTARGHSIPVSSELISKRPKIFQNVNVTGDDLKSTANSDTGRNFDRQVNCLRQISPKEAESTKSTDVRPLSKFAGFTTARGHHLPVSSALISKKTNIFDNVSVTEDDVKGTANWIGDTGRVSNLQGDCMRESSSKEISTVMRPQSNYAGFTTARGRHLPVSSALISKKTNIFDNVSVTEDDVKGTANWIGDTGRESSLQGDCLRESSSKEIPTDIRPHSKYAGFTTARGRHLPVSSALISKNTNIFENVSVTEDDVKGTANWIGDTGRVSNLQGDCMRESSSKEIPTVMRPQSNYAGFTTARGRHLPVSSTLILKKTNIFDNVSVTEDDVKGTANWIGDTGRESNLQGDCLRESSSKEIPTVGKSHSKYAGFSTPRGCHLPVSSALISKETNIFQNITITEDDLKGTTNWIGNEERNEIPVSISRICKSPRIFDEVKKSTECFREMTNSLDHPQRESNFVSKRNLLSRKCDKSPITTFIKPSPLRKLSMVNCIRKIEIESAKENVSADAIFSLRSNDNAMLTSTSHSSMSFISPIRTPTSSISYDAVTPTNNPISLTQEVRDSAEACIKDDEWDIAASSTPIMKTDTHRNRPRQTRLVEKFDDIAGEDYFESNVQFNTIKVRAPADITSLRKIAFETQRQSITEKNNVKPVPSTLYVTKLASSKLQWKDFVGNERPINRLATENTSAKTSTNVLQLTAENATKFKFNAWDHYSDEFCRENVNGIYLQDDIVVIMDGNCQIGLHEISNAFLSCPSVDPKLIHDKWIENHFKWILIKLAGMERSFPHLFSGKIVTLENLILQLKYRYDREIDQAERSAIRKICEMDDIPAKRMILFVAKITRHNFGCEVELSDGWYSLTSTFDNELTRFVNMGKIKVGTKLVIQGAEVAGLDNGCHPLDRPSNVRLRICANSTRRCKWDSKLGYCKNPSPFRISLSSVLSSGGDITKLRIYVLRVYPVVYLDTKTSDTHSEKVERRRSMEEERIHSLISEKFYSQVLKEYEAEEKTARRDNRPNKVPKPTDISTITDPATLCYLLDEDNDPTRIEYEMTESQKQMVLDHRYKLDCLKMEAIKAKVNEKLSSVEKNRKHFVPLLRFKVTDDFSFDKTALVTFWRPTDDILSMIHEGSVYDMTGTSARGTLVDELQIYAGKKAKFNKMNLDCAEMPRSYHRRHISISEIYSIDRPVLNQVDTTGYVVHIGEVSTSLHPVFIADSDQNILCIYFWNDLKNYAYDDIVLPKRFLAIKNLQWRPNSNSEPIPCTYAMDYTIFTENPKSSELLSQLTSLKQKFLTVNMNEFMEICMEKIKSHRLPFTSAPLQSNSMSSMQSPVSSVPRTPTVTPQAPPTLSNQSRIERLSKYGDAMATPPLQIKSFTINYKQPGFKN